MEILIKGGEVCAGSFLWSVTRGLVEGREQRYGDGGR